MRVRIKVCGLTNLDDTFMCVELGVDAVGFVFHRQSKRFIEPKDAVEIIKKVPPFVSKVAVLTQYDLELINYLVSGGFNVLQIYFDIGEEVICRFTGVSIVRAGILKELKDISNISKYDAVLVDNDKINKRNMDMDWDAVAMWRKSLEVPLIVAGGLQIGTVGEVIAKVRPFAVDVAGGVENVFSGRKDHKKLKDFINVVFGMLFLVCIAFFLGQNILIASSSQNYQMPGWVFPSGGGKNSSSNFSMRSVIGEGIVGETVSNTEDLLIRSGFLLRQQDLMEESKIYDIAWVKARQMSMGLEISERVWQPDDTPYFYWQTVEPSHQPIGYSYSIDSEPDDQVDTSSAFCDFSKSPLSEGKHTFRVKAQNSAGSWGEEGSFEIWIDKSSPYVEYIYPEPGTLISSKEEQVVVELKDVLSGVNFSEVSFSLNGTRLNMDCDSKIGKCTYSGGLPSGQVTAKISVKDNAGNVMPDYMWSFTVDVTGPVGEITINHDAPITYSVKVLLSLSAQDDLTSVKFMRVGNTRHLCLSSSWLPFSSQMEWMLTPNNGPKEVFVQFMDEAGNVSSVYSDSILLQILAPDTTIISGPSGVVEQREAYFRYIASEEGCYFSYKLDDGDWSQWSMDDSVLLVGLSDGRHVFSVRAAKDLNGNHTIDADEIDPTPAQRIWFVGKVGIVKKKVRISLWRVE